MFGDNEGFVHIFNRRFEHHSFKAFSSQVTFLRMLEHLNVLVCDPLLLLWLGTCVMKEILCAVSVCGVKGPCLCSLSLSSLKMGGLELSLDLFATCRVVESATLFLCQTVLLPSLPLSRGHQELIVHHYHQLGQVSVGDDGSKNNRSSVHFWNMDHLDEAGVPDKYLVFKLFDQDELPEDDVCLHSFVPDAHSLPLSLCRGSWNVCDCEHCFTTCVECLWGFCPLFVSFATFFFFWCVCGCLCA